MAKQKPKGEEPKKRDKKSNAGAPSLYREEYNEQARKLCLLGATDEELADFFGVCEKTINNWKEAHPQFLQSIKKGKQVADAEVADALYNRALGYSHKEDKIFQYEGAPLIVPTVKHYPPDPTAAIFWLKNRAPKSFRDKQDVALSGNIAIIVDEQDAQLGSVHED